MLRRGGCVCWGVSYTVVPGWQYNCHPNARIVAGINFMDGLLRRGCVATAGDSRFAAFQHLVIQIDDLIAVVFHRMLKRHLACGLAHATAHNRIEQRLQLGCQFPFVGRIGEQ